MARIWRKRWVRVASTIVSVLMSVGVGVWVWDRGLEAVFSPTAAAESTGTQTPASLSGPPTRGRDTLSVSEDQPFQVASLEAVNSTLSQMVFAASEQETPADAVARFREADDLRSAHSYPEAVRDYIMVIERFPNSIEAKAADARANFIMEQCSPEELDAIEAVLPADKDLTQVDSLTVVGQYHYRRAKQVAETDPERAQAHIQKIYEMAWRAFEDKLDDDYKMTILDAYLSAADVLGKGETARKALSEHANTLPPCFTAWLIKAEVDANEPPFEYVSSLQAQSAVRKYYMIKAKEQSDAAASAAYFIKARDAAWRMLLAQPADRPALDHCNVYLGAANGLGSAARDEAVANVEKWIENQPLSIMRWVVRYELAVFLTRPDCTAAEARAGYANFEAMIEEGDTGLVEGAVADTAIDGDTRGLLMCMWGHAHAGTNRVGEATQFYRWVLGYFPEETHAGESAAYALAVMHERENYDSLQSCVDTYEEFVDDHPGGFYGPEALVSVAKRYSGEGDQASALNMYERIANDYGDRALALEARAIVEEMRQNSK